MGDQFICVCPFCSGSTTRWEKNRKLSCLVGLFILLLLLGSCESYHFRLPREKGGGGTEVAGTENSSKLKFSQTLDSKGSADKSCKPVGKCRPCSWIDMNRKVPECLEFGFKQRSYCTSIKNEKFTSCHFVPNFDEARRFWLFEGSMWVVGIFAYAMAALRNRKNELRTARRIQEQINA